MDYKEQIEQIRKIIEVNNGVKPVNFTVNINIDNKDNVDIDKLLNALINLAELSEQ